jgi:hypothetical protein
LIGGRPDDDQRVAMQTVSYQKSLEMPYPRAAIQTPFIATASPIATDSQAVRNASTAFAITTVAPTLFNSPHDQSVDDAT